MHGNLKIVKASFKDAHGSITAVWFNMPFMAKMLRMGIYYILRGKVSNRNGFLELCQPKILSRQEYGEPIIIKTEWILPSGLLQTEKLLSPSGAM